MGKAVVLLVLVGVLVLGACGGGEDNAAETSVASTTAPRREPILIQTRVVIAAVERADTIVHRRGPRGVHPRRLGVLPRRDHPGFSRKPRSRGFAYSPDDHLPRWHRKGEPETGSGAAG
jgi:hypothetical protein